MFFITILYIFSMSLKSQLDSYHYFLFYSCFLCGFKVHVEPVFWNVFFFPLMYSSYYGMGRMADELGKLREETETLKQENIR